MLVEERLLERLWRDVIGWVVVGEEAFSNRDPAFKARILISSGFIPRAILSASERYIRVHVGADVVRIEVVGKLALSLLCRRAVANDGLCLISVCRAFLCHHIYNTRADIPIFGVESSCLDLNRLHRGEADVRVWGVVALVAECEAVDLKCNLVGPRPADLETIFDAGLKLNDSLNARCGDGFDLAVAYVELAVRNIRLDDRLLRTDRDFSKSKVLALKDGSIVVVWSMLTRTPSMV